MTVAVIPQPLRGAAPWRGMTMETGLSFGSGQLKMLKNCYISKEGNELRRWPGWRLAVDPDYKTYPAPWDQYLISNPAVVQYDRCKNAFAFELVRNKVVIIGKDDPLYGDDGVVRYVSTATYKIYPAKIYKDYTWSGGASVLRGRYECLAAWIIDGKPDFDAPEKTNTWNKDTWYENNKTHYAEVANRHGHVGGLGLGPTAAQGWGKCTGFGARAGAGPYTSTVTFDNYHGAPTADPFASGQLEHGMSIRFFNSSYSPANDYFHIFAYLTAQSINITVPASWTLVPITTECGYQTTIVRDERELEHRPSVDVAGDRIVMAVPGYGCCFQIPMMLEGSPTLLRDLNAGSLPYVENQITGQLRDRPRCLGIPKGVIVASEVKLIDSEDPTENDMEVGTYWFRVAYRDSRTGEIGLPSEAKEIYVSAVNKDIDICPLAPGHVMPECLANEILVYGSLRQEDGGSADVMGLVWVIRLDENKRMTGIVDRTEYGLQTATGTGGVWWSSSETGNNPPNFDQTPPFVEQQPRGAKAIRTMKGTTFIGGFYGDSGASRHLQRLYVSKPKKAVALDEYRFFANPFWRAADTSVPDGQLGEISVQFIGGPRIPPAYSGDLLHGGIVWQSFRWKGLGTPVLSLTGTTSRIMDRMVNINWHDGKYPRSNRGNALLEYLTDRPVDKPDYTNYFGDFGFVYLEGPRGILRFSELDKPGSMPQDNRHFLDNSRDEDIEGLGKFRDSLVVCTRTQTYVLDWSTSPAGGNPILVHPEFGCICANSMVEYDGGVAWLSDRGPVAMTPQGVRWIGAPLLTMFQDETRLQRDGKGIMSFSFGAHDQERGLIYFGVIDQERLSAPLGLDDDALSFQPCNLILAYSYVNDAWSMWEPPPGMSIYWMRSLLFEDGKWRMCFLSENRKIYGFEEDAVDNRKSGSNDMTQKAAEFTYGSDPDPLYLCIETTGDMGNMDDPLHPFWRVVVGMEYFLTDPTGTEFIERGIIIDRVLQTISTKDYDCVKLYPYPAGTNPQYTAGDIIHIGHTTMELVTLFESFGDTFAPKRVAGVILRYQLSTQSVSAESGPMTGRPLTMALVSGSTRESSSIPFGYKLLHPMSPDTYANEPDFNTRSIFTAGDTRGHMHEVSVFIIGGQQTRLHEVELLMKSAGGVV